MPSPIPIHKPSPENSNFTFIFGTSDESEQATSPSTHGGIQMEPLQHAFTPTPTSIPGLPSISVTDYSHHPLRSHQKDTSIESGIEVFGEDGNSNSKTKTKTPLYEELSGVIDEKIGKGTNANENESMNMDMNMNMRRGEEGAGMGTGMGMSSQSQRILAIMGDRGRGKMYGSGLGLRPLQSGAQRLDMKSRLPDEQSREMRDRGAVEIQAQREQSREEGLLSTQKQLQTSMEKHAALMQRTKQLEDAVRRGEAERDKWLQRDEISKLKLGQISVVGVQDEKGDVEGRDISRPVISVVRSSDAQPSSVQEVLGAIPLELLHWQMRPPPFDFEGSVIENSEVRDRFWKGFVDALEKVKEGESVEIRVLKPVGGAEVGKNVDLANRLEVVQKGVETHLSSEEVGGEKDPAKMEQEVEKEKKKRRRPKSKRPPAQKVESESVVDLGRKMEEMHLSPQERKAPQAMSKDTQLEGCGDNCVKNERQAIFHEDVANTMTQNQFDAEIDSKMSQICDTMIKAVNFPGKAADEATWTMDIVRLLEGSDYALGNVLFPDDGKASVGGDEWLHMKDMVLKLAKLWEEWNKTVKKPQFDAMGVEAEGMLNALFEKNIDLVKEWLWSRVVRHRWVGLGLDEGDVTEKAGSFKNDTTEQENLEIDESMEYISPTSLIYTNTETIDAKMLDENFMGVGDLDSLFTTDNLIPSPLKLRNSNSHLETHQSLDFNIDSTINLNSRLSNIEHLLQIQLNPSQQSATHHTVLHELKDMVQEIKDAVYGQNEHGSGDNSDRVYAKKRGLLFLCKLAEEWAEDSKYSTERVESALLGDKGKVGGGLMEICREIRENSVVKREQMESEKWVLMKEVERLQGSLTDSSIENRKKMAVGLGIIENGGKHARSVSIELGRDVYDEEMARLKMQNETLEKELLDCRQGRMELVDKMLELDREVEEKDSPLMEVLWPQGEENERQVVRKARYRRDEMLGEKKKLVSELGVEKAQCGVM